MAARETLPPHVAPSPTKFPYQVRAQFAGTIRLLCPKCSHVGIYKVWHGHYRIECANRRCRTPYTIGLVLYPIAENQGEQHETPADMTGFPPQRLAPSPWFSGDSVHQIAATIP